MNKVEVASIRMGELFSRCQDGYLYMLTGQTRFMDAEKQHEVYCLDSKNIYYWKNQAYGKVYLQYKEEKKMFKVGDKVELIDTRGEYASRIVGMVGVVINADHQNSLELDIPENTGCSSYYVVSDYLRIKKEETTMEIPKAYKALLINEEGVLVSTVAGKDTSYKECPYMEGEITYAPNKSMGIFTSQTIEQARGCVNTAKLISMKNRLVVHEATPLGVATRRREGGWPSGTVTYPAILLGKEVWRKEELRPEPKFKVGDKVRSRDSVEGEVFDIVWLHSTHYYKFAHLFLDENMITLASIEEWVDVTSAISAQWKLSGNNGYIELSHGGVAICGIGLNGDPYLLPGKVKESYKVERGNMAPAGWNYIKVLHKELH